MLFLPKEKMYVGILKRSGEKAKNQRAKSNFLHDINFF